MYIDLVCKLLKTGQEVRQTLTRGGLAGDTTIILRNPLTDTGQERVSAEEAVSLERLRYHGNQGQKHAE